MEMTPQHFHTILTSCAILPTMPTTNSLHALTCSLFKHTKWTSLRLLTPQSSTDPYLPFSAAIQFHNIPYTPTYHTDPALLMHSNLLHAAKQIISAMLSMYIAATHNITYPPYISTCTTHRAIPTTLPLPQSSPTHTTNKHKHTCVWSPFSSCPACEVNRQV